MANSFRPAAPAATVATDEAPGALGRTAGPAVRLFTDLDTLRTAYGAALDAAAQPDPFDTLDWFRCVADHGFDPAMEIRVYVADAGHAGTAFLFCGADRRNRVLWSLGNFFTMSFGPVFAPGTRDRPALVGALARFVAAERPRWHALNFRTLMATDPRTALLEDSFRAAGFAMHRYSQSVNRHHPLQEAGFDAYFAGRPSQLRNTIRRREKKLRAAHEVRIAVHRGHSDTLLDDYDRVYVGSWKEPEIFPRFVRAFCRMAGRLGVLWLSALYVDDRPAAAQIWVVFAGKAIIYKLAYDEAFKDFSPGSILTRDTARRIMDEVRVTELDYGVGPEPYKRDWMDSERAIVAIEAASTRTLTGLSLAARSRVGDVLRPARTRLARALRRAPPGAG